MTSKQDAAMECQLKMLHHARRSVCRLRNILARLRDIDVDERVELVHDGFVTTSIVVPQESIGDWQRVMDDIESELQTEVSAK